MSSKVRSFPRGFISVLLRITGLTLIISLAFSLIKHFDNENRLVHDLIYPIIFSSAVIAFVVATFSYFLTKRNTSSNAVALIIGSTSIRMILSIVVLAVLLLGRPENRLLLVLNFLIIYLFYLLFEIYFIITNLRQISKKDIS